MSEQTRQLLASNPPQNAENPSENDPQTPRKRSKWSCKLCPASGQNDTELGAAQAFLDHYCHTHPNAIEQWNRDMREGASN